MDDAEAEVQKKRVAVKTADKTLNKLAKDVVKAKSEIEELTVKLEEDKSKFKVCCVWLALYGL